MLLCIENGSGVRPILTIHGGHYSHLRHAQTHLDVLCGGTGKLTEKNRLLYRWEEIREETHTYIFPMSNELKLIVDKDATVYLSEWNGLWKVFNAHHTFLVFFWKGSKIVSLHWKRNLRLTRQINLWQTLSRCGCRLSQSAIVLSTSSKCNIGDILATSI